MKNVLLLETVPEEVMQNLKNNFQVFESYSYEKALENSSNNGMAAIVTRGKGNVNQKLIDNCRELEVIARCGVGLDNIDVRYATSQGIKVVNAPGSNADTMAEHTLGLLLMAMRQLYKSVSEVNKGNWQWRSEYSGDEIRGKTLGILGLGNIGKKVAAMASAFGMNIIYWDNWEQPVNYPFKSIDELLRESDVISLHLPLIPETKGLLNKARFEMMKTHAYIVNTARGGIVNTSDLINALDKNIIAGYAADVVDNEPPPEDDPLIIHPKTLITPHSGSLTKTTYFKMCDLTVNNAIDLLSGKSINEKYIFNHSEL